MRDGGADNVAFTFTVTQASGLPKTVSYSFADGFLYELEHDASAETEGVNVDGGNVIAQLKVTQSAEGAAAVSVVR